MKKIDWTEMSMQGNKQIDALQEFLVRVDELNLHADDIGYRGVTSRMLDLIEDLFTAFGDSSEMPDTLNIRQTIERECLVNGCSLPRYAGKLTCGTTHGPDADAETEAAAPEDLDETRALEDAKHVGEGP